MRSSLFAKVLLLAGCLTTQFLVLPAQAQDSSARK